MRLMTLSSEGVFERRVFPLITIDKEMLDAVGKQLGFIWMVWLMVGPTLSLVYLFLSCIKGVCTDGGVEKWLPDCKDRVPAFFKYMDPSFDIDENPPLDYLLPNAIHMPGWQHKFNNVL